MSRDSDSYLDPSAISDAAWTDALIYAVTTEPSVRRVILTVEIDPKYHVDVFSLLGWDESTSVLVDLAFDGVDKVGLRGLVPRPSDWAEDEKPHNCEIARVSTRRSLARDLYHIRIDCVLGQRLEVAFKRVSALKSASSPGVVHEYGSQRGS